MEFLRRAAGLPARLGILAGTFNPVTVAHLSLAAAALSTVNEVLFALPRVLPHKEFTGASFCQRMEMLSEALRDWDGVSIAAVDAGLYVDIAAECRVVYGPDVRLSFICGRDAAERVAGWNYEDDSFDKMLSKFDLLVAARQGEYHPRPEHSLSVNHLELESPMDEVSASEVRRRICSGEPWRHLVPPSIHRWVAAIYGDPTATPD